MALSEVEISFCILKELCSANEDMISFDVEFAIQTPNDFHKRNLLLSSNNNPVIAYSSTEMANMYG